MFKKNKINLTFANKSGFSLIELLVVISIIGLLSSLAVVSLNSARQKARDAVRKADMAQLRTALNLYYDDKLKYPDCRANSTDAEKVLCYSGDGNVAAGNGDSLYEALITIPSLKPYMGSLPKDPRNPTNTLAADPVYFYGYQYDSANQKYTIYCTLESGGLCDVIGY